jgi:WD40 repeat protein
MTAETKSSRILCVAAFVAMAASLATPVASANVVKHKRHRRPALKITPLPTPSAELTPALRTVVLIAGGTGTVSTPTGESPAVLDTVQIYDPAADRFVLTTPMTAHRDRHAATLLPDGKVLIVGGVDTVLVPLVSFPGPAMPWILPSTEILDPRSGHFILGASMKTPRDEPTATLLENGKVLIVGGGERSAELYDTKNNTFTAVGKMAESRYGQTATLLGSGKVLISGGGPRRAELFDPARGKFVPTGKMRHNRIYHTATLLSDGRVLIAGGSSYARSSALDTTEIYDPKTGAFRTGPRMKESRAGHTATLLKDGRVLITGGHDDNSAEIYDPAVQRFVARLYMSASRYGHSATLLPDGRVLIAGGWAQNYKALESAEIYDPVGQKFTAIGDMAQACAGQIAKLISVPQGATWVEPTPAPTPTPTPTPTPSPTQTSTPGVGPTAAE